MTLQGMRSYSARREAAQILPDRALGQSEREPDLVLAAARVEREPDYFKHLPHGYPRSCHSVAPERVPEGSLAAGWDPAALSSSHYP